MTDPVQQRLIHVGQDQLTKDDYYTGYVVPDRPDQHARRAAFDAAYASILRHDHDRVRIDATIDAYLDTIVGLVADRLRDPDLDLLDAEESDETAVSVARCLLFGRTQPVRRPEES